MTYRANSNDENDLRQGQRKRDRLARTHELEEAEPRRRFPQQHDMRLIPYAPQLPTPPATQGDCWSAPNGRVPNVRIESLFHFLHRKFFFFLEFFGKLCS
ncbi:hypothetical protein BDN72DRAFT_386531 [Pluteus cervinus]|uniref:Uncharacterized protein n=1 Tax=Pluteus cervinus TaxID=181527 RepID=A0ACD3AAF1_9AGAR|nr:hypothetical protein BDN72DRAFT_386531 [Pluteus cervinus]